MRARMQTLDSLVDDAGASLPSWVGRLDDASLTARAGAAAFHRGVAYAAHGHVLAVSASDGGAVLLGSVRGTGPKRYQTVVRRLTVNGSPTTRADAWTGHCSCPVGHDCKHAVALVVTVRDRLLAGAHLGSVPSRAALTRTWERQIAEIVRDEPSATDEPRLGLMFELHVAGPPPGSAPGVPAMRVRLRPVVPGRSGRWVKTGVSWRDVEHTYGRVTVHPRQREVLLPILSRFRSGSLAYGYGSSDPSVHLDDLGPVVWELLRSVRQAGIPLVSPMGEERVELSDEPADTVMDLTRIGHGWGRDDGSGEGADMVATVGLRLRGRPAGVDGTVHTVGDPVHGLFVNGTDRLLLAPLRRPLDAATSTLVRAGAPIPIPAGDVPRFLARYYPVLQQRLEVVSSDHSVDLPEVRPPRLALSVHFEPRHRAVLRWDFAYEVDGEPMLVPLSGPVEILRQTWTEASLVSSLGILDKVPGLRADTGSQRRLVPEATLTGLDTVTFASDVLPALLEREDLLVDVVGTVPDYAESAADPVISVRTSDVSTHEPDGWDWFDLDITVDISSENVPLRDLLTALAVGEDHLILDSGTWFRLDRPELQALHRLVTEARSLQDAESDELRISRWQAGLWDELVDLGVVAEQSERWSRCVGSLLGLTEVPTPEPPRMLQAELRPYQVQGYQWLCLLWDHQLGGVLADDMGLGKTLQTLAMLARAREQGTLGADRPPALIVAPTSVVSTWVGEAERFCPDLTVVAVTETQRRSGRPLSELVEGADLVVTSYALLRIDDEAFRSIQWSGLVLDEAQFVKNHRAKTYQAARRVPAAFRMGITGTPMENSLMDLWSVLSIAAPGLFPNPQQFDETYRRPIERGRSADQLATLRRRIRPLMLRRTKDQVAGDLPPKIEQTLEVSLNPAHRRVYDRHLQRERMRVLGLIDDMQRNRIAIFRSLTTLRRACLDASLVEDGRAGNVRSSKLDVLMQHLDEVAAEGHRALVFSQFTGFLSLLRERLAADGIEHCYLDGRTRDRPRRIREFTQGTAPVFLISLKAGGFGLTLTEADYVFLLDPWWNPAAEAQAVDRTHRIGQDKTVNVYRLVATDTIEEKVVALQQRKRDLFAKVMDDGAMLADTLTAEDIRGLFDR